MAPQYPFSEYRTRSHGEPITFIVGPAPNPRRFDIHQFLLSQNSPLFNLSPEVPRIISRPIYLPTTDPDAFECICHWMYIEPPAPQRDDELQLLMELWVVFASLGMASKMNTIMRIGMALMQPREFKCSVETVEWVYAHTAPGSKLRGYIVAMFCQRGPELTTQFFVNATGDMLRDLIAFTKVLNKVRAGNPQVVEGYDLPGLVPVYQRGEDGRLLGTLVTGGMEVDWSRVEYPLPEFLVWGEKWEMVPDEKFFVKGEDEWQEGGEVLGQLKKMV